MSASRLLVSCRQVASPARSRLLSSLTLVSSSAPTCQGNDDSVLSKRVAVQIARAGGHAETGAARKRESTCERDVFARNVVVRRGRGSEVPLMRHLLSVPQSPVSSTRKAFSNAHLNLAISHFSSSAITLRIDKVSALLVDDTVQAEPSRGLMSVAVQQEADHVDSDALPADGTGRPTPRAKRRMRWTSEELALASKMRVAGKSFDEIQAKLPHRTKDAVKVSLDGLVRIKPQRMYWAAEEDEILLDKLQKGETHSAIRRTCFPQRTLGAITKRAWLLRNRSDQLPHFSGWSREEDQRLSSIIAESATSRSAYLRDAFKAQFPDRSLESVATRAKILRRNTTIPLLHKAKPWTESESSTLRALVYQGHSMAEVGQILQKPPSSVRRKVRELGLKCRHATNKSRRLYTEAEDAILRQNLKGRHPPHALCALLPDRTYHSIQNRLFRLQRKAGVPLKNHRPWTDQEVNSLAQLYDQQIKQYGQVRRAELEQAFPRRSMYAIDQKIYSPSWKEILQERVARVERDSTSNT